MVLNWNMIPNIVVNITCLPEGRIMPVLVDTVSSAQEKWMVYVLN